MLLSRPKRIPALVALALAALLAGCAGGDDGAPSESAADCPEGHEAANTTEDVTTTPLVTHPACEQAGGVEDTRGEHRYGDDTI